MLSAQLKLKMSFWGQYAGYREADGVAPNSRTPTFAAIKLFVDNWRWKGVPFYLRSGKALQAKNSEIVIEFQNPPHLMFNLPENYEFNSNLLSICIQPDEGIHLKFEAKKPDSSQESESVIMEFHYKNTFAQNSLPDAYERLLLDALTGDASLFARSDEIEQAWRLIDPIINDWDKSHLEPEFYSARTWGPKAADELLAKQGHIWRSGCLEHLNDRKTDLS